MKMHIALTIGLVTLLGALTVWGMWADSPPAVQAQGLAIRYVATTGTDAGDCADPAHPCATVQYAVGQAAPGNEVRVAHGIYTDMHVRPIPLGYPYPPPSGIITQAVYIDKSLSIRGGYTTTDWTTSYPISYPTTLDARGQGRVFCIIGDITTTIEGLRITGGDATRLGGGPWVWIDAGSGGGMYALTTTITLRNSRVFSNTAHFGGGFHAYGSAVTFISNTVTSNITEIYGGGLSLRSCDATLSDNTVAANIAEYGGGVSLWYGDTMFDGNVVTGNVANHSGGGLTLSRGVARISKNTFIANSAYGGGGLSLSYADAVMLKGNTISANTVEGFGGGVALYDSDTTLSDNTVTANTAVKGGGLYLDFSTATFDGNIITANAAEHGGGVYLYWYSDAVLTNDIIADNRADVAGSGLSIVHASPRLAHTTIARNHGGDGSGIYVPAWSHRTIVLTNTILVSHTMGITVTAGNTITLEATLWGTGTWANGTDWAGAGTIITGTRNVWGDPAFLDPTAGDYHIGSGSAALNAGVDAGVYTDIDGEPRPYQLPDLGADEYWPPGALKRLYLPLVFRG